jgi:hypothetical protein
MFFFSSVGLASLSKFVFTTGEKILRREESFPRDLFYLSSETMKRAFSLRIQVLPGSPIETRDKNEYSRVVSMIWFESSIVFSRNRKKGDKCR